MTAASWITSFTCSSSVVESSENFFVQWLRFVFLSPCPQRALLFSVDLLFLLVLLVFAVQKLYSRFTSSSHSTSGVDEPLIGHSRIRIRTNIWFSLSLIASLLLALCCTVACIFTFSASHELSWKLVDGFFWLVQGITHLVIAVLIIHEKRFRAITHPVTLRVYWVANFIITTLFMTSGILRFASEEHTLLLDDIISIASFPISAILLCVGIRGKTGIISSREPEEAIDDELLSSKGNVCGFASASLPSKAFWLWMNPLLNKAYKSPLKLEEVPTLSPDHRAERMSRLFESNWPKPEERVKHPIRTTLFRCFWREVAFTAFLAILRLCVMYVGPILIQDFVDYTAGKGNSPYEGYYLVMILLAAKFIEVLSAHQFNFHSQKLGMLIRSALVTSLYKKGLRLSCSARQAHGVGQIVNYMAVDAQQVSDMMLQLHALWVMPLQILVALGLLYNALGVSVASVLVGIAGVFVYVFLQYGRCFRFMFSCMQNRDSRMKATNELLSFMRVIKLQAWEEHFNKRIEDFRDSEFGWLAKFLYTMSGNLIVMWCAPLLISVVTFGVALLLGIQLDAGTVFTTTSTFKILEEPIRTFPQSLISLFQPMVSLERLDHYMLSKELESYVERTDGCDGRIAVEVKDGVFSWDDESSKRELKNINLEIKKGKLSAVVGTVGSGKSSLLASILGEMNKISGTVRVCGTTAYVAQTSWVQNGTIEENILFGLPMNREKYKEVINVCCLEKDLEMMEFGDQTEIGERGINLSGGQKQRIQLARAIYQDCDIYLLDDVFSAVDAHTGSDIFKNCVRGVLKGKTVVLVTHQVDFLHNVDLILVMRDGMVVQSGNYNDLMESGLDFGALVAAHENALELVESENQITTGENSPRLPRSHGPKDTNGENSHTEQPKSQGGTSKLIEEEERETGKVDLQVYKAYCTEAFGWWGAVLAVFLSIIYQASQMAGDYWLAYETAEKRAASFNPTRFISVYGIIAVVSAVLVAIRFLFVAFMGLTTAQIFFKNLLRSLLHAPMSFFDTTPSGRILSRVSADQSMVDVMLPLFLSLAVAMYATLLSIIIITCQYAWPTVFLLIPLGWLNIWYR